MRCSLFKYSAALVTCGLFAPAVATAQVLYSQGGIQDSSEYGYAVSGAGDVNNDGMADMIAGGPRRRVIFRLRG